MSTTAKRGHASKRNAPVIKDEDSTSGQSTEKSLKREEEPDLSAQVAQLQQELAESQDMYMRACRKARENELRAENSENLLDSKRGVLDGTKKDKGELELENEALKKEVDKLRKEKEELQESELALENDELKAQNDELRKEKEELQASLDDATTNLIKYGKGTKMWLKKQNPIDRHEPTPSGPAMWFRFENNRTRLYDIGDPTNIFQLCRTGSNESMSLSEAGLALIKAYNNVDHARFALRPVTTLRCEVCATLVSTRPCKQFGLSCSGCEACDDVASGLSCIFHFFSHWHQMKVNELDAGVSRAAVDFWVRALTNQDEENDDEENEDEEEEGEEAESTTAPVQEDEGEEEEDAE